MSDPLRLSTTSPSGQPPAAGEARARQAIARAASRTGADFDYLLAQAKLESSLDPSAKARTSSASGLYQFIDSTWLHTLDRHGEGLGLGGAAAAIDSAGGRSRVADPAQREAIMALRFDPDVSALMAGSLANDNRAALSGVLGREPDSAELYLAHFLGASGAGKFLGQLGANPEISAASILPKAAAANRSIFYEPGGSARSVGGVMDLIRVKMAGAMENGAASASFQSGAYPLAARGYGSFQPATQRSFSASGSGAAAPLSMADTLKSTFAVTNDLMPERARDHVRGAYAALRAFKL